jgi:tetratricopeptide (TPR) repeat protein
LYAVGRHQEGRPEWETALRLDPLSTAILLDVAEIEVALGRTEIGLSLCRKAITIQPSFSLPYRCEANMLDTLGLRPEAKAALEKAVSLSPEYPAVLADLGALRMRERRRAEAQAILRQVLSMSRTRYVPAFVIAKLHFILGDERSAIEWLERAREERSPRLGWYIGELAKANLFDYGSRTDDRFTQLVVKVLSDRQRVM